VRRLETTQIPPARAAAYLGLDGSGRVGSGRVGEVSSTTTRLGGAAQLLWSGVECVGREPGLQASLADRSESTVESSEVCARRLRSWSKSGDQAG